MKGKLGSACSALAFATMAAIVAMPLRADAAGPVNEAATTSTEVVARERPTTRSFYGWQILVTGGAGGVLAAASFALPDSPLKTLPSAFGFVIGAPLFVLGGPATHWTHGAFEKGVISVGANLALPVVSGLVGQSIRCSPSDAADNCGTRGFVTGFAIALVTVPIVDALVLGWENIPDEDSGMTGVARSRSASKPPSRFTMTPTWRLGPKGAFEVGVVGRF